MSSYNPLVPTTENMAKEGMNIMETKYNVVKTAITHHRWKNKIDTVNKTEKLQAYKYKR